MGKLKGYRTYLLAAGLGIGAIINYLVGDADLTTTAKVMVEAAMFATVRGAIPKF